MKKVMIVFISCLLMFSEMSHAIFVGGGFRAMPVRVHVAPRPAPVFRQAAPAPKPAVQPVKIQQVKPSVPKQPTVNVKSNYSPTPYHNWGFNNSFLPYFVIMNSSRASTVDEDETNIPCKKSKSKSILEIKKECGK